MKITYKKSKQGGKILPDCHATYVTEAFKKTHTTFKALNIVINNAGIFEDRRWELEIATNLVS
jgi:short-subunit dehydrogenase involved in D-alanine esterification of teichoic acids